MELSPLSGGYSGSRVWRTTSQDALGHRQAPSVVKLGPNRAIAQERVAFERIEEVLGNNAPRVRGFVDLGDRAGLRYSYAAMGHGSVRTLQSMFAADVPTRRLISVVRATFGDVLRPLYAASQYERMPILQHYGFTPALAPSVRQRVATVAGSAASEAFLAFPGGLSLPNVCSFYEDFLTRPALPSQDYHYVSYVHGDLNAANVLVDAHRNVWVIDFFQAGRGHVLKDLAKFENDLLYVLTPVADLVQFEEALAISRALISVDDLQAPLPERLSPLKSVRLIRAWEVLRVLRRIAGDLCHEDRNPLQFEVALLRYAIHTLGFPECSPLQKRWALAAACLLAEQIQTSVEAEMTSAGRLDRTGLDLIGPGWHHRLPGAPRPRAGSGSRLGSASIPGRNPTPVSGDGAGASLGRGG